MIFEFVNHPQKAITIAQNEMWKTKIMGGIKLINLQMKSETSKVKWLIELATDPNLNLNLGIFTALLGQQKGNITGRNLMFLPQSYMQHQLKTESLFYKDALSAMSKFETIKGIPNIQQWDNEHLFYNKLMTGKDGKVLKATKYCEKNKIFTLEQLLDEKAKETRTLPFNAILVKMFNNILLNTNVRKDDILITRAGGEEIKLSQITQKELYEEALLNIYRDHKSQTKWGAKLNTAILWEEVWAAVHNFLLTNDTKTIIWQQLHLNFYTQYSYNKWHGKHEFCPLCKKNPENIYHIILHCDFANILWEDVEHTLMKLHPVPVSTEEKALGIVKKNPTSGILLRNWVTYSLRKCIMQKEQEAYYNPNRGSVERTKVKFNQTMASEVKIKMIQYKNENNLAFFDKMITHAGILCEKVGEGEYCFKKVFL